MYSTSGDILLSDVVASHNAANVQGHMISQITWCLHTLALFKETFERKAQHTIETGKMVI